MSNPFEELNNKLKDQETKLTKREYVATQALAGCLSASKTFFEDPAYSAVYFADKLIAELNKPRSN